MTDRIPLTHDERLVLAKTLTGEWTGTVASQNEYFLMGRFDPFFREVKRLEQAGLLRKGEESGRNGHCFYHATEAGMEASGLPLRVPG